MDSIDRVNKINKNFEKTGRDLYERSIGAFDSISALGASMPKGVGKLPHLVVTSSCEPGEFRESPYGKTLSQATALADWLWKVQRTGGE